MAQPLDRRSLRFSWTSLTAVNDPDGTRGYFNSCPDSILPLARPFHDSSRVTFVAKFAAEIHPYSGSFFRKKSLVYKSPLYLYSNKDIDFSQRK